MTAAQSIDSQKLFYNTRWQEFSFINGLKLRRCVAILDAIAAAGLTRPEIVDLGCGAGWLIAILGTIGPSLGVDLSPTAIAQAARRYTHVNFAQADICDWDYPTQSCDLVVSHEVLEHVESPATHLNIAHGLLRTNGFLVLTTPNKPVVESAFKNGADMGGLQPIENWVSVAQLRSLLVRHFEIVRLTTVIPGFDRRRWYRVLNSTRLRRLLGIARARSMLDGIALGLRTGLHILAVAKKV